MKADEPDWEQQQAINNSLEEAKDQIENFQKLSEKLDQLNNQANKHELFSDNMIAKFRDLQKLIEEIFPPELMKNLDWMQEALENMDIDNQIANLFTKTDLTGKDLINAGSRQEQTNNKWEVILNFNNEGGVKFARITKEIAGTDRFLSIILELLHFLIPNRSFEWSDLFGNFLGVVVVIIIKKLINKYGIPKE